MPQYLLDTNICILLLRNRDAVREHLRQAGPENCFISEITVAELYFGAEKNPNSTQEFLRTVGFVASAQVLPIGPALRIYARQRWRLRRRASHLMILTC
ncbi:MAG: PIN domain-containing protein [Hymenobacter sp.]